MSPEQKIQAALAMIYAGATYDDAATAYGLDWRAVAAAWEQRQAERKAK